MHIRCGQYRDIFLTMWYCLEALRSSPPRSDRFLYLTCQYSIYVSCITIRKNLNDLNIARCFPERLDATNDLQGYAGVSLVSPVTALSAVHGPWRKFSTSSASKLSASVLSSLRLPYTMSGRHDSGISSVGFAVDLTLMTQPESNL